MLCTSRMPSSMWWSLPSASLDSWICVKMTRLSFSKQVSINSVQESKQLSTLVNTCSKYNQVPSLYFWLTLLIHCIYLRYDSCIEFRHMYFFASQLCSDNGSFVIFSHPFSPLVSSLCALCDVPCTNLLFK